MTEAAPLVELWRGDLLESRHSGHAVICDGTGQITEAWGDAEAVIYPRSSCKMIQALPLIESGAADAAGLSTEQLALSCASHMGAAIHTDRVRAWLGDLEMSDADFRCGPQEPRDIPARDALIQGGGTPCQYHHNCSGKHCGFLTLNRHLGAGPEYHQIDHPMQIAIRAAFEEVTGEDSPTWGIDGCSVPNHATTVHGLARAMARFANAAVGSDTRSQAMVRLATAMRTHPELISGEGEACTELMRAANGRATIKGGAEGVYTAILPDLGLGVGLKITDGAARAAQTAIAAILARLGVIDPAHPYVQTRLDGPILNTNALDTGRIRPAPALAL